MVHEPPQLPGFLVFFFNTTPISDQLYLRKGRLCVTRFYIIKKFPGAPYIDTKIQESLFCIDNPVSPSIILVDYVYSKNLGEICDKIKYHSTNKVTLSLSNSQLKNIVTESLKSAYNGIINLSSF